MPRRAAPLAALIDAASLRTLDSGLRSIAQPHLPTPAPGPTLQSQYLYLVE